MPALSFLAFVGLALIALLFYGNATLEPISPEIVTPHHAVAPAPAPAPNMTSQVELQPKSAPDALAKIGRVARAARAEAPPKNNRVSQTLNYQVTPLLDRFSIKDY
ncbi:MAG: hypothetical protein WCF50_25865 [Pseudolabrys sp.]